MNKLCLFFVIALSLVSAICGAQTSGNSSGINPRMMDGLVGLAQGSTSTGAVSRASNGTYALGAGGGGTINSGSPNNLLCYTMTGTTAGPCGSTAILPSYTTAGILTNDTSGTVATSNAPTITGTMTASAFKPTGSTIPTDGYYLSASNTSAIADRSLPVVSFTSPTSSVNYWVVTGSATGIALGLTATGSDTNIGTTIVNKGTGQTVISSPSGGSPLLVSGNASGNGVGFAVQNLGNGGHTWSFTAEGNSGGNVAGGFSLFDATANATPFAVKSDSRISLLSTGVYGFSSQTQYTDFSLDTGISRAAAGAIALGTGASGNTGAKVTAAGYITGGTKFTLSGSASSLTVGGATAGQFISGVTGTGTWTITINGATGLSTPSGWNCGNVSDITTIPALFTGLMHVTSHTTTTCTISGTTVSGDEIDFSAVGY